MRINMRIAHVSIKMTFMLSNEFKYENYDVKLGIYVLILL